MFNKKVNEVLDNLNPREIEILARIKLEEYLHENNSLADIRGKIKGIVLNRNKEKVFTSIS